MALQVALQVVEQVYVKKLQPQKRRYETIRKAKLIKSGYIKLIKQKSIR